MDQFPLDFQWACWNIKKLTGSDLLDYFTRSYLAQDSFVLNNFSTRNGISCESSLKRSEIETKIIVQYNTKIFSFNKLRRSCGKTPILVNIFKSQRQSLFVARTLHFAKYIKDRYCIHDNTVLCTYDVLKNMSTGKQYKCILLDEIDDDNIEFLANYNPNMIISMKT